MLPLKQYRMHFYHSSDKHDSITRSFDYLHEAQEYLASIMVYYSKHGQEMYCEDETGVAYYNESGKWGFRYYIVDSNSI